MSRRDPLLLILDMLEAVAKVERYTQGLTYEAFSQNDLVLDAVVRNLEVIGEAARHLPEELKGRYGELGWRRVVGFRNLVIHQYFDVDPEIVWTVVTRHIPELRAVLERMREELGG